MEIIAIPDIHGDTKKLKRLAPVLESADLVLLVGDITNFGREKEIRKLLDLVRQHNSTVMAVIGNCDFPEVEEVIDQEGLDLNGKCQVKDGLAFIGLSGSLETPFHGTPNEVPDSYFKTHLTQGHTALPENTPVVLVSHQPPINTSADRIKKGLHVGSTSVRQYIEQYQPLICFTGHIHEGAGIDSIGNTKVVNPGPFFRGKYVKAVITHQIETLEICSL
jgi:uncharacterized protein